jgi:DNA-nicking Smr family endonuclease
MSKARGKSGGGDRAITPDEAELWKQATRTLEPVKAKPRIGTTPQPSAEGPPRKPLPPAKVKAAPPSPPAPPPAKPAPNAPKPPPVADFDRRKARQIASGRIEIDAKLDLHGDYQRDARPRLRAFLFAARDKGHKTVLVITGKGADKEPPDRLGELLGEQRQRGVLRRNVPRWLEEPELRTIVLSYTEASPRHGGSGALYVRLRKA